MSDRRQVGDAGDLLPDQQERTELATALLEFAQTDAHVRECIEFADSGAQGYSLAYLAQSAPHDIREAFNAYRQGRKS